MRWRALVLAAALGGCSQSVDIFHVYDPERRVLAARVDVCGSETPMLQHGEYFFIGVPIDCEGSGRIDLVYRNGTRAECEVGQVTDLSQEWYFRAEEAACQPRRMRG